MVDVVDDLLVGRTRHGLERIDGRLHPLLARRIGRVFQPGILGRLLLVDQVRGFGRIGFVEERGVEIDLDHTALFGQGHDHLVGHIAGMVAQGPAAGVGRHHGSLRIFQHVPERIVGDMRHVDQHPQPVHLRNHVAAEGAQAAPARLGRGAGVADLVAAGVRQGHIGDTHAVEHPQKGQVFLDRSAVLHAHENGNQAVTGIAAGLRGRRGQGRLVGVLLHDVIDLGDQFERPAGRPVGRKGVRRVDGEEGAVDAPLLHPREIDMGYRETAGGATLFNPPAEIGALGQHQRRITVGIKQEHHKPAPTTFRV